MLRRVRVSQSEPVNGRVTAPATRAIVNLIPLNGARRARDAMRRTLRRLVARIRGPVPGQFQPYNHTLPDRYPWLFRFAAERLSQRQDLRILSFGCSLGEEVFSLRNYFPTADIKGIDIDPRNIRSCQVRARAENAQGITFITAATTQGEPEASFDAIFCLAVLCLADLTTSGAQRCDPLLHFDDFERMVADFARCLKPGGLLLLHTTNFRFCDTATAQDFDTVFEVDPAQLAPDVLFDRNNKLMKDVRYCAVAFSKRGSAASQS
jgi:SAM-dependent methyltransferase